MNICTYLYICNGLCHTENKKSNLDDVYRKIVFKYNDEF